MNVSFIIPCYNASQSILRTISSIYLSKLPGKSEIIVVDDASTDSSVKMVEEKFSRVKIIRTKSSRGAAKARNIGISFAKYDILFFIDSDVWLKDGTAAMMLEEFHNSIDIVFPRIIFENGTVYYPLLDKEKEFPGISACFAIRKSSLCALDANFDEFYKTYLEDNDFFARCYLSGLRSVYAKEAEAVHSLKPRRDLTTRMQQEIHNIIYGNIKFSNVKMDGDYYLPFKPINILKALFCSAADFAWFNWQEYDRNISAAEKIKVAFSGKNRISDNWLGLQLATLKSIAAVFGNLDQITENRKRFRLWHQNLSSRHL